MNSDRLAETLPKILAMDAMPVVPAILQPLTELLRLPPEQVKIERVVELVSYDGAITAHCLRMANSPLFGRRNTETVRGAVVALAVNRVESIVLSCCMDRIVLTRNGRWTHSRSGAIPWGAPSSAVTWLN